MKRVGVNRAKGSQSYRSGQARNPLEHYLDINEWQVQGIQQAVAEADSPAAEFVDHDAVLKRLETIEILRVYHTSRKWPEQL